MKNHSFSFYIILSSLIHISFVIIFIVTQSSFFSKKTTIKASVRVNTIGLPELKKQIKKTSLKKQKSVQIKKKKVKKKKVKKKTIKKEVQKKENQKEDQNKEIQKEKTLKGNTLSEGIEDGSSEAEQMQAINIYLTLIIGRIKINWNLPKYLTNERYYAQIEIRISDTGELIENKIVQPSGNPMFDGKVLKAIDASAPFPAPPSSAKKLIKDGIVFGLSSTD